MSAAAVSSGKNVTLLLVDDNPDLLEALAALLRARGFITFVARNGALKLLNFWKTQSLHR